jgi:hypothetical protein
LKWYDGRGENEITLKRIFEVEVFFSSQNIDSVRIIPTSSTSAPRKPGSRREHPGAQKKAMEAPTDLYELTISSLGPIGHVNLLMDVKVISLYLSDCITVYKRPPTLEVGSTRSFPPLTTRTSQALYSPHCNHCSS